MACQEDKSFDDREGFKEIMAVKLMDNERSLLRYAIYMLRGLNAEFATE